MPTNGFINSATKTAQVVLVFFTPRSGIVTGNKCLLHVLQHSTCVFIYFQSTEDVAMGLDFFVLQSSFIPLTNVCILVLNIAADFSGFEAAESSITGISLPSFQSLSVLLYFRSAHFCNFVQSCTTESSKALI
jgi:hypothetical protein